MLGEQWLHTVPLRLRSLFCQRELETELEEELRFHLDEKTRELIATGLAPAEARRVATLALGSWEQCKEECRDARGVQFIQETWQDIRYGARLLRKTPGFTAIAVVMLGVVIGANAVVFGLLSALLLDPLPYGTPEKQLVLVWENFRAQDLERIPFSAPEVSDLRQSVAGFEELAAFRHTEFNITHGAMPERIFAAVVSPNLFSVLNVPPLLGRVFTANDVAEGMGNVVVISETLWRRKFDANPAIVGQQILLSGRPHTVLAVMPARFRFPLALFNVRGPVPGAAEVWKPIGLVESEMTERTARTYGIVARIGSGLSLAMLNGNLLRVSGDWQQRFPENYASTGFGLSAHHLRAEVAERFQSGMLIVAGAVFVLLLIALADLLALLLARANARTRELDVRIALGARPLRLFRQFLAEGLLLAGLSGIAALVFAGGGVVAWRAIVGSSFPLIGDLRFDRDLLLRIVGLSLVAGSILGGMPGWRIALRASRHALRDGANVRGGRRWERLRDGLVVLETALALVLLIGAGLLTKSFLRLKDVGPGLNPNDVVTLEISLPSLKYPTDLAIADFFSTAAARVKAISGVTGASFTSILPLSGINQDRSFTLERSNGLPEGDEEVRIVTADYFAVLEIPSLKGRPFDSGDTSDSPAVVVINSALARKYWPADDPIGQRIKFNDPAASPWMEIVGVVGNVRHRGLDEAERPEVYVPHAQMPSRLMTLVARTRRTADELLPGIREQVRSIDSEQPIANVRLLDRVVADSIAPRRHVATLVVAFAAIALLLSITGVYGVISYSLVERRREIAMRIALGAQRRAILGMIFAPRA